jgi:hypothetical protein
MSKITLFDGSEILISAKQAQALERSLADNTDGFVKVNDNTIKKNAISSITPGGITETDLPYTSKQIGSGNVCKSQYSIQLEINNIARSEGGSKWSKLVTDKAWREQTRQKLRVSGALWCDSKANECHCDSNYQPQAGRHQKNPV